MKSALHTGNDSPRTPGRRPPARPACRPARPVHPVHPVRPARRPAAIPARARTRLATGMAKMTNCGGMGQCLTCKVVLTEPDGQTLYERSEYEDAKLAKFPSNVRLACMTLVEGDVRVDLP